MHSPWVSRVLSGLGHEVIVAHARNVRLIGESRRKDDRLDAQTLARLARIDPQLLCPVKHRRAKAQADLMVIRARAGLVRARTALVNTARGLAKSYGERLRGCNVRNMNPEKADGLSPELRRALQPLLAGIAVLSAQIREYNERIERLAQESYPQVALLNPCATAGCNDGRCVKEPHGVRSKPNGEFRRLRLTPGPAPFTGMDQGSPIRWQYRLKRERLSCSERKSLIESADGRVATAARFGETEISDEQKSRRSNLTPTGLLMEGVYTQNPCMRSMRLIAMFQYLIDQSKNKKP
jgi:Transposase